MSGFKTMLKNIKGFTLVELIVVMAVFVVVLAITASSFDTILKQTTKLFRSEESNIEGVVGLEMLRHDLQQTGLGLFTEFSPVVYKGEASSTPASNNNDYDTNIAGNDKKEPPRPIVVGNNLAAVTNSDDAATGSVSIIAGSDYLSIKSTAVGINGVSQKWTYLEFDSGTVAPHAWQSGAENFDGSDKVVLLKRQITSTIQTSTLVEDGTGPESFYFSFGSAAFNALAALNNSVYTAYGISAVATLRMPFNRSDYFVARPSTNVPAVCAPNVGILYKATVNHSNGKLTYIPLIDCVADMQVVLEWDMNSDGMTDSYSNADGSVCNGLCPASVLGLGNQVQDALSTTNNSSSATIPNIRNNLKIIKAYILAQDGRRDPGFTSPSPIMVGGTGETALTRSYDIATAGLLNYRWKLYRIVVRPKNLPANQ